MSMEKIETLKEMDSLLEALCDSHQKLSPRQLEFFSLLYEGHSLKEIASQLRLSEQTVRTYRTKIKAQFEQGWLKFEPTTSVKGVRELTKPPLNAEYLLYFFLRKEERESLLSATLSKTTTRFLSNSENAERIFGTSNKL